MNKIVLIYVVTLLISTFINMFINSNNFCAFRIRALKHYDPRSVHALTPGEKNITETFPPR